MWRGGEQREGPRWAGLDSSKLSTADGAWTRSTHEERRQQPETLDEVRTGQVLGVELMGVMTEMMGGFAAWCPSSFALVLLPMEYQYQHQS